MTKITTKKTTQMQDSNAGTHTGTSLGFFGTHFTKFLALLLFLFAGLVVGGSQSAYADTTPLPVVNACSFVSDSTTFAGSLNAVIVPSYNASGFWTAIPGASWIWSTALTSNPNTDQTVVFEKDFYATTTSGIIGTLKIAGDNIYTVTLNGTLIGSSTAPWDNYSTATTYDITSALAVGTNKLVISVTNRGYEVPTTLYNPAGLLYRVDLISPACTTPVHTNTAPTISLLGASPFSLVYGSVFTDPGATANDAEDGNITNKIVTTGTVNTLNLGTTMLSYSVTDTDGLSATTTRQVVVTQPVVNACTIVSDETTFAGNTHSVNVATQPGFWTTLPGASWIWSTATTSNPNTDQTVLFEKDFYATTTGMTSSLKIAGDNVYKVTLNGAIVAQSTQEWDNYSTSTTYNISPFIISGTNKLVIEVTNKAFQIPTTQYNAAGLLYRIDIQGSGCNPINTAPTITLTGATPFLISQGQNFTDPGATAFDQEDGNITANIVKTGTVNTANLGTTTITYTVSDSKGLTASTTRTVVVVAGVVNNKPTILLVGANPFILSYGSIFTDPGATAFDQEDGNITANIVKTGTVDSNTLGTTTLAYSITDSKGLSATTTRQVVVTQPVVNACTIVSDETTFAGNVHAVITTGTSGFWTSIPGASWIWSTATTSNPNTDQTVVFEKDFYATTTSGVSAVLKLAADNLYKVTLNGTLIGSSTEPWDSYSTTTTFDITSALVQGINKLVIEATNRGFEGVTTQYNPAGLLYRIELSGTGCSGVVIPVNHAPVLTLTGATPFLISQGQNFTDPGATAFDQEDGNITANIVKTGTVNTANLGTTTITYTVSDSQGLAATPITRQVVVVSGPVNHPPVITLTGINPASVNVGETYTDPGATAFDQEDGNITSRIVASSTVDTTHAGSYTVEYNVTDSGGLHATPVLRTVNVLNPVQGITGTIRVCLAIANNQNVLATSSTGLPTGTFQMNLSTSTSFLSSFQSKTWTSNGFAPNSHVILSTGQDADCVTYNNLPLGDYYYSQLGVTGSLWNVAKYSDEETQPVNNIFDFFSYSPELFNIGANTNQRNINADGLITLGAGRPERTLVLLATYNPAPVIPVVKACYFVSDTTTFAGSVNATLVPNTSPWLATIPSASWIWLTPTTSNPNVNQTVVFEKDFYATTTAGVSGILKIAADNIYTVTLNGVVIGTSTQPWDNFSTATTYNITSALVQGTNKLVIEVTNKGYEAPTTLYNPAGLLYRVDLTGTGCSDGGTGGGNTHANLSVTKTADKTTANVGDTVTYTIRIINNGPDDATTVKVTDLLPSGLTFVSASTTSGAYATSTGVWTIGTMLNGSSTTMTLLATVKSGTEGQKITNTAVGSSDIDDGTPSDNTTSVDVTINTPACTINCGGGGGSSPSANISVIKTADKATANAGDTVTYTITVTNSGPDAATNVTASDILPNTLTFVSATTTIGTFATSTGMWTIGTLANGSSTTLTLVATINSGTAGQQIANSATASSTVSDPTPGNNTSTVTVSVNTPACTTNCGGGGGGGGGGCTSNCGGGGGGGNGPIVPNSLTIFNEQVIETAPGVAFVTWNTNIPATRRVVYGNSSVATSTIGANYGYPLSSDLVSTPLLTQHSIAISISPGVTYYFRPVSTAGTYTATGKELSITRGTGGGTTESSCYYLYDYLRKDFNNDPIEVKKLQVFLRDLEGYDVQITGVYDDQTIVSLDAFQNRYFSDILAPWGHDAPTGYTYILTKKKVNEIYCRRAFPVTPQQQEEIDSFRAFLESLKNAGVNLINRPIDEETGTTTPLENTIIGSATSTTASSTNLAVTPGTNIGSRLTANVIGAGKKIVDLISRAFKSIFGMTIPELVNIMLVIIISIVAYFWYKEYKNGKKIEDLNKEIDTAVHN